MNADTQMTLDSKSQTILQSVTDQLATLASEFIATWDQNNPENPIKPTDQPWLKEWSYELAEMADGWGFICDESSYFDAVMTYYLKGNICAVMNGEYFLQQAKAKRNEIDEQAAKDAMANAVSTAITACDQLVHESLAELFPDEESLINYAESRNRHPDNFFLEDEEVTQALVSTYESDEDGEGIFLPLIAEGGPVAVYLWRDLGFIQELIAKYVAQNLRARPKDIPMPIFPARVPEGQLILEGIA